MFEEYEYENPIFNEVDSKDTKAAVAQVQAPAGPN